MRQLRSGRGGLFCISLRTVESWHFFLLFIHYHQAPSSTVRTCTCKAIRKAELARVAELALNI